LIRITSLYIFILWGSYSSYAQLSAPVLGGPPDSAYVVYQPFILTWSAVSGATCYNVSVLVINQSYTADDTCTTTGTALIVDNLLPNTLYHWRVTAYSPVHGWGTPSEYKVFTTAALTPGQSINNLIQGVIDLISELRLNPNQGNILINKLEQARARAENGQKIAAIANMLVFKLRIFRLRASNQLSANDYSNLNYSADGVIDLISEIDGSSNNYKDISHMIVPDRYSLKQNYPNPFNPVTTIEYSIPVNTKVTLKIYDMLGREVATLVNEYKNAGTYITEWNATGYSSGIYFYSIITPGFTDTRKMVLTK